MLDRYTQAMVDYALSKVGCGYIYGATGWICSEARRKQQYEQYPEDAKKALTTGAKWDGKQCFDCAQLVLFAVEAGGGSLPSGATTQWNKTAAWLSRGTIGTLPDGPCILYRESGGRMQHTGVYIGDGWVVDARGTAEGVVKTKLSSYAWTHWGLPVLGNMQGGVNDMEVPYKAIVRTRTGNGVSLWNDSAKTTRVASVPEGAIVNVIGKVDAAGFALAVYEGVQGMVDTQYLNVVIPAPETGGGESGETDAESVAGALAALARVENAYGALGMELAALRAALGVDA